MKNLYPPVDLKLMGDWGNANWHTIVGWIAANMRFRSEEGSDIWIKTSGNIRDAVEDLSNGVVDLSIVTPYDVTFEWAREGKEFFAGTPHPKIVSLGWLPQDDRLVFAVRADTGMTSFEDIRKAKFPLKIACPGRGHNHLLTEVMDDLLRIHGITPEEFKEWGGEWLDVEHPRVCIPQVTNGVANAVFNEAIMVPQWMELVETVPMSFIAMEPHVLDHFAARGLRPGVLAKGRLGQDWDVPCFDFAHWAIIVRDDMDEDLAYRITAVMVEERAQLEARYAHLPVERSPMTYPINPYEMWKGLGGPLHPGAIRYYREHGYMP